ncbi:MAG: protein kinase [Candidatus Obscuribacterales bacterium]|nr:protein kinase [Candidatus Obscuribacterales bacterium]
MLTAERNTCPRDFFELTVRELPDPIPEIFSGRFVTDSCLLPGERYQIFKAVEQATGKMSMIALLPASDTDTSALMNFAQKWSDINHTNVLPITTYGASPKGDYLYVVSPYPHGQPLTSLLDEKGNLATELAIHLFLQLCEALEKIGAAGLIHGNCMPAHILIAQEGSIPDQIKLSCMSAIQRFLKPELRATEISPLYLGLEYFDPKGEPDETTDIYSLACVMYVTLTGLPPFVGKSFEEIRQKHLEEQPLSLRGAAPDLAIPALFDKITLNGLSKIKQKRQAGARVLKQDLISAADKSRIYLPTYMEASYEVKPYQAETGGFDTVARGAPTAPPVEQAQTQPAAPAQEPDLPPESRAELEGKVKDLRSHVYLVTTIAVGVLIGLGVLLMYEGPPEDHAPAWKKLTWTVDMSNGDNALNSRNLEQAQKNYSNALEVARDIEDGGDRRVKTLRKLRTVHEELHDKKGAEEFREEIIKFDKHRLEADEAPAK